MGSVMVLASHAGNEILGAGQVMAKAFAQGERIGIIVLAESAPDALATGAATSTRVQHAANCQAVLQELLGEVPPLLMLSYPLHGHILQQKPALAEDSMLVDFLHSIDATTLLVTNPGHSDPAYKAALWLASCIIRQGLAEQLVIVPIAAPQTRASGGDGRADQHSCAPEVPPIVKRCEEPQGLRWTGQTEGFAFGVGAENATRFARISAALEDRWYPSILELGCSDSAITPMLAAHCDKLVTLDASQAALERGRLRAGAVFNIEMRRGVLPRDLPTGAFDLVILNNCLQDLNPADLTGLAQRLPALCKEGCRIIVASGPEETTNDLTGELATELLMAELPGWTGLYSDKSEQSQIQVLERR